MASEVSVAQLTRYSDLPDSSRQMCKLMELKLTQQDAPRDAVVDKGLFLWFQDRLLDLERLKKKTTATPKVATPKNTDESMLNNSIAAVNVYLDQTFDVMSVDFLSRLQVFYGPYQSNKVVATILERIKVLQDCVRVQKEIEAALNSPYDTKKINELSLKSDKTVLDHKKMGHVSEHQYDYYYNTTGAYLTRYTPGVKIFQSLIKAIRSNKDVLEYRKTGEDYRRSMAKDAVLAIFDQYDRNHPSFSKKENESAFQFYISHIPYLNERFERYRTAMFTDPVAQEKIENEILSIKVQ